MYFSKCKAVALSQCVSFKGNSGFVTLNFTVQQPEGEINVMDFRITDQNRFEKRIDAAR